MCKRSPVLGARVAMRHKSFEKDVCPGARPLQGNREVWRGGRPGEDRSSSRAKAGARAGPAYREFGGPWASEPEKCLKLGKHKRITHYLRDKER